MCWFAVLVLYRKLLSSAKLCVLFLSKNFYISSPWPFLSVKIHSGYPPVDETVLKKLAATLGSLWYNPPSIAQSHMALIYYSTQCLNSTPCGAITLMICPIVFCDKPPAEMHKVVVNDILVSDHWSWSHVDQKPAFHKSYWFRHFFCKSTCPAMGKNKLPKGCFKLFAESGSVYSKISNEF